MMGFGFFGGARGLGGGWVECRRSLAAGASRLYKQRTVGDDDHLIRAQVTMAGLKNSDKEYRCSLLTSRLEIVRRYSQSSKS